VVMLVREGAIIPHIKLAQSTKDMDWLKLELVVFAAKAQNAEGLVCLPSDNVLREVAAAKKDGGFALVGDPLEGKAAGTVKLYPE
jgi:alpha-D-xyloside xylohydrolase